MSQYSSLLNRQVAPASVAMPENAARMSLALAGMNIGLMSQTGNVICEGWMLKKRRKKMQGFARRYFKLYESGLLEYGFDVDKPARDHLLMQTVAISTTPGQRDIHLDASNITFHIKCLTTKDFESWMTAFRTFVTTIDPGGDKPLIRRISTAVKTAPRLAGKINKSLSDMGLTISELEDTIHAVISDESKKKHKDQNSNSNSRINLFKRHHPSDGSHMNEASEHVQPSAKLHTLLESLRNQHSDLVDALRNISLVDNTAKSPTLATTREEVPDSPVSSRRDSRRTSIASGLSVWFDAEESEGATEFIMEQDSTPSTDNSHILDGVTEEGDESYSEHDDQAPSVFTHDAQSTRSRGTTVTSVPSKQQVTHHHDVKRRTQLPSGPIGDEGSLFSILKKSVGKDLSQVAMPVSFNEPLTLLQRSAEELEYFSLLDQATQATDEIERLCYIAAFVVSGYACTKNRSGRKSFNPMLGETFEDTRMKFIAEKVVHAPLVIAYHAEGEGWELTSTSSGKTKFWGKSLEIIPMGKTVLRIGQNMYEWKKPSSFVRNLVMGTKYLEHTGETSIVCKTTGARCLVEFQEAGYWSPPNVIKGTVYTSSGSVGTTIEGKWDEQLTQKLDDAHLKVLWRINPFPKNSREYYGFTSFGITLHETTPDLSDALPPTDSRLRSDVTALERGDLDAAEAEKLRLEEAQRARRRAGNDAQPRWFRKTGQDEWEYAGGYWEQREKGWQGVEPLW